MTTKTDTPINVIALNAKAESFKTLLSTMDDLVVTLDLAYVVYDENNETTDLQEWTTRVGYIFSEHRKGMIHGKLNIDLIVALSSIHVDLFAIDVDSPAGLSGYFSDIAFYLAKLLKDYDNWLINSVSTVFADIVNPVVVQFNELLGILTDNDDAIYLKFSKINSTQFWNRTNFIEDQSAAFTFITVVFALSTTSMVMDNYAGLTFDNNKDDNDD